jgi:hypothetical protein
MIFCATLLGTVLLYASPSRSFLTVTNQKEKFCGHLRCMGDSNSASRRSLLPRDRIHNDDRRRDIHVRTRCIVPRFVPPPPFPPQQTCLTLNSPLPLPRPTGRPRPRRPPPQLQFLLLGALHPQFLSRHQPNQRHGGRQPRRAGGQPFIQQAAARQRDIAHERRPLLQTLTFE